ncbi:MAG: ABC transporter ATP-binding protein [Pseudomonadales bacterium]|nr:ABC transporter ATP-binding protein [Pseudomonadales bacterium]
MNGLRNRQEWHYFSILPKADGLLAIVWWILLAMRGLLPALFAIAMGYLVGAVQGEASLALPLSVVGVVFLLLQVLTPVHQAVSSNLGSRTAAYLYDELTVACVEPPGIAHLENPRHANDLTMARDFDLGISGPSLSISMDFIASGLVEFIGGVASALVLAAYAWWAPFLLGGAWLSTHWLLRESGVWRDRNTDEVQNAQRHADYSYRMAVDPPAAKELRLFGLSSWTIDRFREQRRYLHDLRWAATRLRERPVLWSVLIVTSANVLLFWSMASAASDGALPLERMVTFASAAIGCSMIAFGGLSWALDGAAAPAAAVSRLRPAMAQTGSLKPGARDAAGMPAADVKFDDVTFHYPGVAAPVLDHFDLTIPAGSSLAIVGQNGAGKTTLAKLLCRLYDPVSGAIKVDGVDLTDLSITSWRRQVTAVFQDFIRFELTLRENVAPFGAPDDVIMAALAEAGADRLAELDTVLSKAYKGGTDLSGGQWQRIALARTLCAVASGARLVLLDEPTAQLDIRGEAEIFNRILDATREVTTILVSHRFSTVRKADRICVLEHGRVVELGSHEELMALGGRYRTMFELQASRFGEEEEGADLDALD